MEDVGTAADKEGERLGLRLGDGDVMGDAGDVGLPCSPLLATGMGMSMPLLAASAIIAALETRRSRDHPVGALMGSCNECGCDVD